MSLDYRMPLFDRLTDDHPAQQAEPVPLRRYNQAQALASIRRELTRLLGARRATLPHRFAASIIDYGVPDWSGFAQTQATDTRSLQRQLTGLLTQFEPRIHRPQVQVSTDPDNAAHVLLQVSGSLVGDAAHEPVVFINAVLRGEQLEVRDE